MELILTPGPTWHCPTREIKKKHPGASVENINCGAINLSSLFFWGVRVWFSKQSGLSASLYNVVGPTTAFLVPKLNNKNLYRYSCWMTAGPRRW